MIPLIILGLLKQNPGSYGYELLALMDLRHYKYIVNFTKGSFYYHLQQMEEKGLINRIEAIASENTREAQHYVITELGEKEFEKLMHKYGTKTDYVKLSFFGAMLFVEEYPSEKFEEIVKEQLTETKNRINLLEQSLKTQQELPTYFRKMLENSRSHHMVNLEWFEEMLANEKINER
ncbi:PadR family transcriptional regulator [Carnobacterium divergens]|uniref:PadR family transcriptional regulator n=1 Tax=Carnobacterium divergens TaxID=2748 RepID=UPI0007F4A950|nr:PadR family transcriptional regulator [Carnobacterium divergens]SBO17559.1 Transcriptional regulator, PadR family [Carnobacterium divergens]